MRKSIAEGSFYPDDKDELKKFIKKTIGKRENILAGIVPHAGYMFSGSLAGKVIGKFRDKKDFILLGVNHSGIGNKISFSLEDFETPLGLVKNNKALSHKIMKIMKKEKLDVDVNEIGHEPEHSLEVQLPFLQVSQKSNKFEIIPILLKNLDYDECVKVAEILSEFIDENVGLIVSSDFTHAGSGYGLMKDVDDVKDYDLGVVFQILEKNSEKVFDLAEKSTICGLYGLTIITEISKIKNWESRKIDYFTSFDVTKDDSAVVGYGGIIFQ